MNLRKFESARERREALEKELALKFPTVGSFSLDETAASKKNIENMIGAVQIPLGVAGPLKISGKEYLIPLATTEGALVASVSRGCKAISESGDASGASHKVGTTRGPVFFTGSVTKSRDLVNWIEKHGSIIKKTAESTSKHLTFTKADIHHTTDLVFVRFYFDTDQAMGMNMATIATEAIVDLIENETGIGAVTVAGNFDIDKKPAWLNAINGRGIQAWADVVLNKEVLSSVLKTDAQKLLDVWLSKCMIGSAMAGSLGFNAHFANIIAALYLATGQDAAHVVEGSMGITTMRILPDGNLYVSVYLPALMIGIIGGGTGLSTQKEALSMLKLGKNPINEFAEVIAGAVLAGEISLLASQSVGTLALSHRKLGRGEDI